jgi:hypothetical protein
MEASKGALFKERGHGSVVGLRSSATIRKVASWRPGEVNEFFQFI